MKKLFALLSTILLLTSVSVKADVQFGFGLMTGQVSTDGTESEGTAADTSNRSKSIDEFFIGGDLFMEFVADSGMTYGISYVPVDVELGSGERTDVNGSDAAENDDGTRSASADVSDLMTLYTNIPVGDNGWYGLLGYHFATIETSETLNTSSYPDEDITGYQIGLGQRIDKFKYELSYSDFEDINISSTGGRNSVSADADALTFRISFGF
jgi:hypothetical protein